MLHSINCHKLPKCIFVLIQKYLSRITYLIFRNKHKSILFLNIDTPIDYYSNLKIIWCLTIILIWVFFVGFWLVNCLFFLFFGLIPCHVALVIIFCFTDLQESCYWLQQYFSNSRFLQICNFTSS